jgi:hypothetical protein
MTTILEQAESYRRYSQRKSNAHYFLSEKYKQRHTLLGVFVTLFSTVVGTTIFATITKNTTDFSSNQAMKISIQIITGLLSVLAAVLSAFQTFFRYSKTSQQHKNAAVSYEEMRHKLDVFLLAHSEQSNDEIKDTAFEEFKAIALRLSKISASAPTISDKVWDAIKDKISLTPIIRKSSA